jgi:hypothetical protein
LKLADAINYQFARNFGKNVNLIQSIFNQLDSEEFLDIHKYNLENEFDIFTYSLYYLKPNFALIKAIESIPLD